MKAYPVNIEGYATNLGMDLRDYFAAKVLQGIYSCQSEQDGWINHSDVEGLKKIAKDCYSIADVMMEARDK